MALPVQQPNSGERSSSSWYEKVFKNKRRHHSSAPPSSPPPPQEQQRRTATTRTGPEPVHQKPATCSTRPPHQQAASTAPDTSTSSSTADDDDARGPLSFPEPNFSPALKVVDYDDSVTLVSQATGRRWRVVDSSRGCQFGEVLRAVELSGEAAPAVPPAYFAIKELKVDKLIEMQGRTHEDPLKEVAALQYLPKHPNVLACTEALLDENSIYIVTPFYSGGEVFNALSANGRFEEGQARLLFRQVLDGLLHLKRHGVCHRDVSLENLLFAEEGVVKLVDFGLALRIPQSEDGSARIIPPQGPCGKPYYMAPEVVASSTSSGFDGFAVDVWACGILVFAMLTGVAPFELALPSHDMRFHTVAVRERLTELLSAWNMPLSPEATDLIQSCLLLAPERRPSLEELVNHDWLKG
ncbi:unnamed protein product [Ectocarpus sp. 6 AP-2014]